MLDLRAGMPIDVCREVQARNFMANHGEWLFFLDSDVFPPEDTVLKMLSYNMPIVSGLYFAKKPGMKLPAAWVEKEENRYFCINPTMNSGLIEVDAVGLGCCLIHRSIFERLKPPWFFWSHDRYNLDTGELMHNIKFKPPMDVPLSEDFFFFRRVRRELKQSVVLDMDIRCQHEAVSNIDGLGNMEVQVN
jgi:hypothetical protein